jgi:hypothetical protein
MPEPKLSSLALDLMNGLVDLFRSEVRLARAELRQNARDTGRQAATTAIFGAIAALGVLALLAALILGVGHLLGEHYAISALIVGVVLTGAGAALAFFYSRRVGARLSMPELRESLKADQDAISESTRKLARIPRTGASR